MRNVKKLALSLLLASLGILAASSLSVHAQRAHTNTSLGTNIFEEDITESMQRGAREPVSGLNNIESFADLLSVYKEEVPGVDFNKNTEETRAVTVDAYDQLVKFEHRIMAAISTDMLEKDSNLANPYIHSADNSLALVTLINKAKNGTISDAEYKDLQTQLESFVKDMKAIAKRMKDKYRISL